MDVNLVRAQQENQFALLSNKFDFTIFKYEAPKEYGALGEALGQRRKEDAEYGDTHKTARKLGALFEQIVPQTPKLITAFGQRVSEIMTTPGINLQGNERYGPFASFIGADATALWAAATSGVSALAMYLLATLLADSFDHKAASSLWTELVDCRKKEVLDGHKNNIVVSETSTVAARQNFSREELALWDTSARAWIQSANEAKRKERSQFLLISRNIILLEPPGDSTYAKVINLWRGAMIGMEELLRGRPQSIQDRCIPSAATAWHLFPNLLVLGGEVSNIDFKDNLMPKSATCTIGLTTTTESDTTSSWSLALSHYRYYGESITISSEEKSCINFDQFLIITLGSVLANWSVPRADISKAARWFIELERILKTVTDHATIDKKIIAWLYVLAKGARRFLERIASEDQITLQLVEFGMRRAKKLLNDGEQFLPPFFGLRNPIVCSSLRAKNRLECGIAFLRATAQTLNLRPEVSIIIIDHNLMAPFSVHRSDRYLEFATISETGYSSIKRRIDDTSVKHARHCRTMRSFYHDTKWYNAGVDKDFGTDELYRQMHARRTEISDSGELVLENEDVSSFSTLVNSFWKMLLSTLHQYSNKNALSFDPGSPFKVVFGNDHLKLITMEKTPGHERLVQQMLRSSKPLDSDFSLADLDPALLSDYICWISYDPEAISTSDYSPFTVTDWAGLWLVTREQFLGSPCKSSLEAIAAASRVFENMGNASTISTQTVINGQNLASVNWFRRGNSVSSCHVRPQSDPRAPMNQPAPQQVDKNDQEYSSQVDDLYELPTLTRGEALACLAHFEYGKDVFTNDDSDDVFALSIGNSIYVPQVLLSDPFSNVPPYSMQRLVGNIGHSGLSILVPPVQLRVRKPSSCYTLAEHKVYDMKRENNFGSTSLHLNFTRWRLPVETTASRTIDQDAHYVEAVISLHDRGEWVADLDITDIDFELIHRMAPIACQKPEHHNVISDLRSIDSWEEVLDPPNCAAIFRANENWAARLAAVSLLEQTAGKRACIVIGPDNSCLQCIMQDFESRHEVEDDRDSTSDGHFLFFVD